MSKKQKPKNSKRKETAKAQGFPDYFTNAKLIGLSLFLISCLLYAGTLNNGFVQDDAIVIVDNEFTTRGDIASLFKYDTFRGFFKEEGKANLVAGGRYRPLTPAIFALVWKVSQSPWLFHLLNVLLYGAVVVLLFRVLLRLLQSEKHKHYAYFTASAAALVFAIHPVHTEVVANIKGMDEVLSLLLALGAVSLSLRAYREKNRSPLLPMAGAAVLFFLALLSKEIAVVFLGLAPLALYVFRKADIKQSLFQALPYIAGLAVFLGIRQAVLGTAAKTQASMELMNNPFIKLVNNQWVEFSFSEWLGTVMYSLGKYLQLLVFPLQLTHDYYPRAIAITEISEPAAAFSLLAYLALIALAIKGVWARKAWGFGIATYLAGLVLVSNLLFPIGVNMAERFLFVPSLGFALLAALGLYELCRWRSGGPVVAFRQMKPAITALAVICLLAGYKTYSRSLDWKSNWTLFQADWEKSPNSAKIRNAMGGESIRVSQEKETKGTPREQELLQDALMHLAAATQIHPTYKNAYLLKGNALFHLGRYGEAVKSYDTALQIAPGYQDALNNRQQAVLAQQQQARSEQQSKLEKQAMEASKNGDFKQAIRIFEQLRAKHPDDPKYYYFIGVTKVSANDIQGGLEQFLIALEKDPGTDANNTNRLLRSIAQAYQQLNQPDKAQSYLQRLR